VVRLAPHRVLKLALLNMWARHRATEFVEVGIRQLLASREEGQYEQILQEYLASLFYPSRLADTELISAFLAICRRVGPAAYLRRLKVEWLRHQQ
jgi:hypothetical protein